ncbi:MAG: class I SAM-dependent methyltransferase [Acidobacteriota bacterium]
MARTVEKSVDERRRAKRFFHRVALAFHVIDRRLGPEYRTALECLSLPAEGTVLDIGTGTGTLAAAFAERGHRVTGIDFVDRLLEKARRRVPSGDFRSMDLVELEKMPSGSFDIVCLAYVLHGLSPELRGATLHHAARLARNGVLLFDYSCLGPWHVRLIEWIEGPHYPGFVARTVDEHVAAHRLVVAKRGETSSVGGWWWCVEDDGGSLAKVGRH